jgi:hypothetical protein
MANLNAQGVATLVEAILAAITAIGPLGIDLYLKLEQLFQLGPDEQANVAAAIKSGLSADSQTLAAIEAWKKQVGL